MKLTKFTHLMLGLLATLALVGSAQEHGHGQMQPSISEVEQVGPLQLEEAVFEANGAPMYVVNARARVKNLGPKGYRDGTVHFYCRLDASQNWTLVGERPLPGVPPGQSATCDLVANSEALPIFNEKGEVSHCLYRVEVRYSDGTAEAEGEFHPSCLHEH